MKFYLFFLKSKPHELYAFTIDKEYRNMFMEQRNMNLFILQKVELDNNSEALVFMNKNKSYQICKDVLYDGKYDYDIYATTHESNSLSESCEYIDKTCQCVREIIERYSLKSKYLKSILFLTDVINKDKIPTLKINTFKLFYELFKETFYETEEMKI